MGRNEIQGFGCNPAGDPHFGKRLLRMQGYAAGRPPAVEATVTILGGGSQCAHKNIR
jgi:hypothetical protein